MKTKKIFKVLISITLTVSLLLTGTMQCFAARQKQYVKDIRLSYGDTDAEAIKWLEDNGYKVINQNLNKDANDVFSKKKSVYMGYTITTEPEEAITDISLMDMDGGYSFSDYQEKLKAEYQKYEVTAKEQMVIIEEFRKQYAAKTPNAIYAHQALNNYIEDDTGKLYGDFLLDEGLTIDTLVKVMTQTTGFVTEQINIILSCGIAENSEDNFLNRFVSMTPQQIEDAKNSQDPNVYDNAYKLYYGARSFGEALKGTLDEIEANKDTNDLGEITEYSAAVTDLLMTYTAAESYKFADGSLVDFFTKDDLRIRDLYPLATVMNQAQINAVGFSGFEFLVKTTNLGTTEQWNKISDESDGANVEDKKVSVYYGVDRSLFSDSVAMTSNAQREMAQTGDSSPLYGNISSAAEITMITTVAVTGITAISLGVALAKEQTSLAAQLIARGSSAAQAANFSKICTRPGALVKEFTKFKSLTTDLGQPAKINIFKAKRFYTQKYSRTYYKFVKIGAMQITMYVAMGIMLIVSAIFSILEVINYYNPKYLDIPKIMLDYKNDKDGKDYIRYDGVTDMDGKMGDTNGYVGQQWNALYVTRDPKAGKPLQATVMAFTNKIISEEKFKPIHYFGEAGPKSTNIHTFGNSPDIYVYWLQDLLYTPSSLPGAIFSNTTVNIAMLTGIGGVGAGFVLAAILLRRKKKQDVVAPITTSGE
ncbi:MAG: hypothetical protein PHV32_00790 [Eubacteriales bacterium]|nr:hypothetical protein [Eubacteriales bacterium]